MRSFIDWVSRMLFPDTCARCSVRGALLCASCVAVLPPAPGADRPDTYSVFAYRDPTIQRLIWLLKYRRARRVADVFGPALAALITEWLGEEWFFSGRRVLLVPIPLSRRRRFERGYNQTELLARVALKQLPDSIVMLDTKLLVRTRSGTPQAHISRREERRANIGDCFLVRAGREGNGETVILVDDVTTTGATLDAAARALARAGYSRVIACTVAH